MTNKNERFLSRWSRRKIAPNDKSKQEQQIGDSLSPRTSGKNVISPTDSELPLWQQDNVEEDIKQRALSTLFKQPEFNDVDYLNEYDEDFTQFSGLGDIVTQEMKRMIRVVEERTRPNPVESELQQDKSIDQNDEEDTLA